jgi:predicted unusual protein kinase regulating ubiquinone biosynthesis (AarF/ABC1/UbiB family)
MVPRWRHIRREGHAQKARFNQANAGRDFASFASNSGPAHRLEPARDLRLSLQGLGTIYSCFALYLSSRIDLLPAEYCRELAMTPDAAPPLAAEQIRHIVAQELGGEQERIFAEFDSVPFKSSLVVQYHRATLKTGAQVMIAILRPDYYPLQTGISAEFFDSEPVKRLGGQFSLADVASDFLVSLAQNANFKETTQALDGLASNNPCPEFLACHRIYRELCTRRVLTFEYFEGSGIDNPLQNSFATHTAARRLCHTWLANALFGRFFSVDPYQQNITILEDQRTAFLCREYIEMARAAREDLWSYLMATMADDPDRSAMYLLRQMQPPSATVDVQEFRSSFRQSAYFGALEPILGTDSNALGQLIFQHWKTALAHGYKPKPHLLSFYRGLFIVATIAGKLSRERDFLKEAMEELRGTHLVDKFRNLTDVSRLTQTFDQFAVATVYFPRILDDALTEVSRNDRTRAHIQPNQDNKQKGSLVVFAAIVVIALILISEPHSLSRSSEKAVLILLMLAGLLALRGAA